MRFNRQLFKEAFKQGYKSAKENKYDLSGYLSPHLGFLGEWLRYVNITDKVKQWVVYFDKNGRCANFDFYDLELDDRSTYEGELYVVCTQDKRKSIATVRSEDVIFVKQNNECFEVYFKDGSKLELYTYRLEKPQNTNLKTAIDDEDARDEPRETRQAVKKFVTSIDSKIRKL